MNPDVKRAWDEAERSMAAAACVVRSASATLEIGIGDGTLANMAHLMEVTSYALLQVADDLAQAERASSDARRAVA